MVDSALVHSAFNPASPRRPRARQRHPGHQGPPTNHPLLNSEFRLPDSTAQTFALSIHPKSFTPEHQTKNHQLHHSMKSHIIKLIPILTLLATASLPRSAGAQSAITETNATGGANTISNPQSSNP
ncbi:MAG TPA: hypothetical protein VKJ65_14680, partial [Phycisphaerae bacterium]|nr:hypothetical protein [Phycisphaerae bacterium]